MKRLLLSIHDVAPIHAERIARLEAAYAEEAGGDGLWAMLVVPDFHGRSPVAGDRAFQSWLRGRAAAGCEMFLHGWFHRDDGRHEGAAGLKARHMTAGEGEFLGLTEAEARRRLAEGRKLIEDIIGGPVAGFIAPAWLYGPGAQAALRAEGFAVAEDHFRVWSPRTGAVLSRDPVITYASRSPGRVRSSLLWSRIARRLLGPFRTVRLAVHPHDTDVPALGVETRRAVRAFRKGRTLGRYRDLLPA